MDTYPQVDHADVVYGAFANAALAAIAIVILIYVFAFLLRTVLGGKNVQLEDLPESFRP